MLLPNSLSALTWVSLATTVQSGLIARSPSKEGGLGALNPRAAWDSAVGLVKRAKPPPLDDYENSVLRALSIQIRDNLEDDDLIYFVGNSGSYLYYPFDGDAYTAFNLPISKTKLWGKDDKGGVGKATNAGLDAYWDNVLERRLKINKAFKRLTIVDHSGTGQSVDGFRKAFVALVTRASKVKVDGEYKCPPNVAKEILALPWHFINVVDYKRRPGGPNPVTNPTDPIIQKTTIITFESADNVINGCLGDEEKHPRVECEFPPKEWPIKVGECWDKQKEQTGDNKLAWAKEQRKAIQDWNTANGGLITKTNPSADDPDSSDDEKVVSRYTRFGYKYEVRVNKKTGKQYLARTKIKKT